MFLGMRNFVILCSMSIKTILIHGALGSAKQMQPLADMLGADVICIDLPGHGKLADDSVSYSVAAMGEEVLKHLDGPTKVIGYSMGGYVALWLAAMHPEKVKSVVTIATKFDWTPEGAQQEVRMLNADKILEKVPAFAKLLEDRHRKHWPDVMQRTADMMLALGNTPILTQKVLEKLKCPVLIVRGSEDSMVSKAESLWAERLIPNARYAELKGQPHPLEKVNLSLLVNLLKTSE